MARCDWHDDAVTSILWLRRDLRLDDHPALARAHEDGPVIPLFVVVPELVAREGHPLDAQRDALAAAQADFDGRIVVRVGDPADVVPQVVREAGATSVHLSGATTPAGRERVRRVYERLDVPLVASGTAYAVSPGRVVTGGGTPYKVFTPYARAWREHGWPRPEPVPRGLRLESLPSDEHPLTGGREMDWRNRWAEFADELPRYDRDRDRPDRDGTSRLSPSLNFGRVHPRTLLAAVADGPHAQTPGADAFVTELAWREFYADVLWHHPESAWSDLTRSLAGMTYDDPGDPGRPDVAERFAAWCEGRTGFPIVDAGMRQLDSEGWMHDRLRMITASFLTKDLHVWWPHGARVFAERLRDVDLASNSHGWQWVAGTGTDAAPYFRVFNPITQGEKFDPDGAYVRRYVPELAHLPGKLAHRPEKSPDGYAHGYPLPIVDHAEERREALARYEQAGA